MFDGKSEKVTDFSCCIVFNECSVWEGVVLEASSNLPDRLKNVYVGCEIGEDSPGWHIYSRSEEFIRELSLTIVNNDVLEEVILLFIALNLQEIRAPHAIHHQIIGTKVCDKINKALLKI